MQDKIRTASCFLCGRKTNLTKCEKCQMIYSCSQHFEKHFRGSSCLPVKVSHSSNKGHFLVATRFIEPGEIVLQEIAAVTGILLWKYRKGKKKFNNWPTDIMWLRSQHKVQTPMSWVLQNHYFGQKDRLQSLQISLLQCQMHQGSCTQQ